MRIAAVFAGLLLSLGAHAQTLYVVTVRTFSDPSFSGSEGSMYTVDPSTATLNLIAALHLGSQSMGLDGLAIHPKTGEMFGITAPTAKVAAASLVRVDPHSGELTLVGALGHAASDVAFDESGALFAWLTDIGQVATVDLQTGAATPRGKATALRGIKAGLASTGKGRAIVAAQGAAGTLDFVDLASGEIVTGPALKGAPFADQINGLAYSAQGVLYAINTSFAANSPVDLVRIDPKSGIVTRIGPLPTGTDALAFGPRDTAPMPFEFVRNQWRALTLGALFLVAAVLLFVALRRGKHPAR